MVKNRFKLLIAIIALAVLAGGIVYPNFINFGVDFVNKKMSWQIPHFWEVPFKLGLDLKGGMHLIYEADLKNISEKDKGQSMQGLRDIIDRRVNSFGVKEPMVQVQGQKLIIDLAGVVQQEEAIKMIGQTPFLEFKEKRPDEETNKILDKQKEIQGKSVEELQKIANWQLALQDPYFIATDLTGKYLTKAEVVFDQTSYKPEISLQFNDEGAKVFQEITKRNIEKPLAIYIDQQLISAPIVQAEISGGKAQITGSFTIEEAKSLARNLNAGALPVPIKLVSQQNVGPTLGADSLNKSLYAGIIGFAAILIFMILFYRLPGLLASIALGFYVLLLLALFKVFSIVMTLAGIGGFILSIGMAIDANVLIFARINEERKAGKPLSLAISEGFKRAWPSIRDGNLTTLLVGIILFWFGTSFVKGFALTLDIGILVSMFSAIIVTRIIMEIFANTRIKNWQWFWK